MTNQSNESLLDQFMQPSLKSFTHGLIKPILVALIYISIL